MLSRTGGSRYHATFACSACPFACGTPRPAGPGAGRTTQSSLPPPALSISLPLSFAASRLPDGVAHEPISRPFRLAHLDRPGRHLHRHRRRGSRSQHSHGQASLGEPGGLPGRCRGRDPPPPLSRTGRARSGERDRACEDGNNGGHQCATRARRRQDTLCDDGRIRGPPPHWLPEPAPALRPSRGASGTPLRAGGRGAGEDGGRRLRPPAA